MIKICFADEKENEIMDLTITITYSAVLTRCSMLSQYEGRDRHDEAGKDLYEKIIITDQDKALIEDFLSRSLVAARQALDDMITSISIGSGSSLGSETWTIRSTQRRYDRKGYNGLSTHIMEALAASVMTAWLRYQKVEERSAFYQTIYDNEMKMISDNLHTKAAPQRPTT